MSRRGLAPLPLLLLLAACGTTTVAAKKVEREVADQLERATGERLAVTCPHGLDTERGQRMTCTAGTQRVVVEVVDDDGGIAVRDVR